jgi:hypothetical protein
VKSGTTYHIQLCTSDELWQEYLKAASMRQIVWDGWKNHQMARSKAVFQRMKKKAKVRVAKNYRGNFECVKCAEIPSAILAKSEAERRFPEEAVAGRGPAAIAQMTETKARLDKLEKHVEVVNAQQNYLMTVRHDRIERQQTQARVLCVMDFTKFNMMPNVSQGTNVDRPEFIHDMVMVFEWWPPPEAEEKEEGKEGKEEKKERKPKRKRSFKQRKEGPKPQERSVLYLDTLCMDPGVEKNDTEYVRTAMEHAISAGHFDGFDRVDLFSDGGPKHYKSVYGMKMMSGWNDWWRKLKPGVKIPQLWWNFTGPNHGHGIADSHGGIIAQVLRRALNHAQHNGGMAARGPSNAYELQELIMKMKGTQPVVFTHIERPEEPRIDMKPLKHIRNHFQFRFVRPILPQ